MRPSASPASIIVPAYREAANLKTLVERTFAALEGAGVEAELMIVDDNSQDGTEEMVEALGSRYPVRLLVRREERGLSSAVLFGFEQSRYDRLVVLDADLQHPPELIPALLERLDAGDCDFVIGTRYAPGAVIEESWPLLRRLASRLATLLARPLAPLTDPMSGFFALRRSTWRQAAWLDPVGYKIALELYVKGRCCRPAEVPIRFAARAAGESKLSLTEQLRYLGHLSRLYRFRFPRTAVAIRLVLLATAGAIVIVFA